MITKNCISDVEKAAEISQVVSDFTELTGRGNSLKGTCPFCNKEKKLSVDTRKNIVKCFSCMDKALTPVGFIMQIKTNGNFVQAIQYLAEKYNIALEYEKEEKPLNPNKKNYIIQGEKKKSFRDLQLESSGLLNADQKYKRNIEGGKEGHIEMDRYTSGTINEKWDIIPGDDMIMHYMDLQGNPMTYFSSRSKEFPLIRIRWSNPDAHLNKEGKPMKYQSPYGSVSRLWINETIRQRYQNNAAFDTLFIQEGEKKADKATKHGLYSVGIMGIHNIAVEKQLPAEFQWIIKACEVKNVVFMLDADWNELSDNNSKPADSRPKTFLAAVRNFLDYFNTFNNLGIYLNIYFGYVKSDKDKGIDDLLNGTLKGKEHELLADVKATMNEKNGEGKYVDIHKINGFNEFKLREFFHLTSNDAFVKHHMDELKKRKIFTIGKEKFKLTNKEEDPDHEENTLVLAQPLSSEEEFWEEERSKRGVNVRFHHTKAYKFLYNRKFGRYKINGTGTKFINIEDSIVREVEAGEIKDYVIDFTENVLQNYSLLEVLYRGHRAYLGAESLCNLKYLRPHFHRSARGIQYFYFTNSYWKITADGVEEKPLAELDGHVWADKVKDFDAKLLSPMFKVNSERLEGGKRKHYSIHFYSEEGKANAEACHFYKYLVNASNFYWEKTNEGLAKVKNPNKKAEELNEFELEDMKLHFISKCTGIGYMLHSFFDDNVAKALIAMDGKLSEVGKSMGRSGKSLLIKAFEEVVPTITISGKREDLTRDQFIYENVTESTRVVAIDDVRVNLDFEFFFSNITGTWDINSKGTKKFQLNRQDSPKLIFTTNHAIKADDGSSRDRQFVIAFSDYYNEEYRPVDEHGHLFFVEWDHKQKNLFYNFMATCLQIYFEHGLVSAPMDRIEQRRLRQSIGETFMDWADGYFVAGVTVDGQLRTSNINEAIPRNELTEAFYSLYPEQKRYVSRREFKVKLQKYCTYKGYVFNPGHKRSDSEPNGGDDKRSGIEYFTVHVPNESSHQNHSKTNEKLNDESPIH